MEAARVTDSEFLYNDTRNLDDIVLKENGETSGRRNAKKRETDGEKEGGIASKGKRRVAKFFRAKNCLE